MERERRRPASRLAAAPSPALQLGAAQRSLARAGVYAWRPGDTIPLGATRTLGVVEVRRDDPPVLVVEDMPGSATSAVG